MMVMCFLSMVMVPVTMHMAMLRMDMSVVMCTAIRVPVIMSMKIRHIMVMIFMCTVEHNIKVAGIDAGFLHSLYHNIKS